MSDKSRIRWPFNKLRLNSYAIFYDKSREMWPVNEGDCLIDVIPLTGLTVFVKINGKTWYSLKCISNND